MQPVGHRDKHRIEFQTLDSGRRGPQNHRQIAVVIDPVKQLAQVRTTLTSTGVTAVDLAAKLGIDAEDAFHMLTHLEANSLAKVAAQTGSPAADHFTAS